ncbi:hypothetical protein FE66_15235, partial [Staphylococcus aureus]
AKHLLQHLRDQLGGAEQDHPGHAHDQQRQREIPAFEELEVEHRLGMMRFPKAERDQGYRRNRRGRDDQGACEPVLPLAAIEREFEEPQAECD